MQPRRRERGLFERSSSPYATISSQHRIQTHHTLCQLHLDLAVIVVKRFKILINIGRSAHESKIKCSQDSNIPARHRTERSDQSTPWKGKDDIYRGTRLTKSACKALYEIIYHGNKANYCSCTSNTRINQATNASFPVPSIPPNHGNACRVHPTSFATTRRSAHDTVPFPPQTR